ncbi:MAG: TlpA disulfide reductase family protein [Bacteroidales bacterium]
MASIKERIEKWKSRKWYQKAGDIFFWLLLIMMIIPGPRKTIATAVNKVMLNVRKPSMSDDQSGYMLQASDYQWEIRDLEGEIMDPANLQGEVIFLNYWGTYCPPCIAEMPEIQNIYDDYGDRVKFVLVSAESREKVVNFLSSRDYNLPVYFGGRNMPEPLAIRSLPTTFIIARDGRIVLKKVGAADWDSRATRKMLDQLLVR